MNVDGTGIMRLINNSGRDSVPRWMPDGKRIIYFSSNEDRNGFIVNANSSEKRNLSSDFLGISPCPSPDGKMVGGPAWTQGTEYLRSAQI